MVHITSRRFARGVRAILSSVRVIALVVLLVAATSVAQEQPLRVAVPGLRGVRLSEAEAEFYSEHLAQNLRAPGIVVVTAREIQTLLGIERQKQLLGCGEGSCIAELANALGADAVVLGDVALLEETYQVNVEVIAPVDASVLVQGTRRVKGQVASLDAVSSLARELGRGLLQKKGRTVPAELLVADVVKTEARGAPKAWTWIPVGGGVALAGVGVLFLSLAEGNAAVLRASGAPLTDTYAMKVRDEGKSFQAAGAVFVGVGLAAALVGAGLVVFGPKDAPAVAVVPTRDGAVFSLSGTLP